MSPEIRIDEFAAQLRQQRGKRGLRDVAQEVGEVSASTLSRLEKGNIPDLDTFVRICRWLGVSPDEFIIGKDASESEYELSAEENRKKAITAHLRADRTLDPKTAEALVRLIELAYEQAERGEIDTTP